MPPLRRGDAAGEVHEPLVLLLPEMPTPPASPSAYLDPPRESTKWLRFSRTFLLECAVSREGEMSHDGTVG